MSASTITRINHVDLRVRNLDESIKFYCSLFGFSAKPTEPPSKLTQQCVLRNGSFGIVLKQGLGTGIELGGVDHISLEVTALEDVVRLYRKAKTMNARVTEPRVYEGHWQFFVFDPDGYKIEVMAAQLPADSDKLNLSIGKESSHKD